MLVLTPLITYITTTWLSLLVSIDSGFAAVGLAGPCAYGYCQNIISSYAAAEATINNPSIIEHLASVTSSHLSTRSMTITVPDLPPLPNATIIEDHFIAQTIPAPDHTAAPIPQPIIHILDFTPVLCSKTGGINPPSTPQALYRNMSIDSNVTPLRVYSGPKKACLDGAMQNYIILIVNTFRSLAFWAVTMSIIICCLLRSDSPRRENSHSFRGYFRLDFHHRQARSKPLSRLDAVISGSNVHIDDLEVATIDSGEITIIVPPSKDIMNRPPTSVPPEQQEGQLQNNLIHNTESEKALQVELTDMAMSLAAAEEKNKVLQTEQHEMSVRSETALRSAKETVETLSTERDKFKAESNHHFTLRSIAESLNVSLPKRIRRLESSLAVCEKDLGLAQSSEKVLTNKLEATDAKLEMSDWRYQRTETMRRDTAKAYQDLASIHMCCHGERQNAATEASKQLTAITSELKIVREQLIKAESQASSLDHRNTDFSQKLTAAELEISELRPRLVKAESDLEREKAAYNASDRIIDDLEKMKCKVEKDLINQKAMARGSERVITNLKAKLAEVTEAKDKLDKENIGRKDFDLVAADLNERLAKTAKIEGELEKKFMAYKSSELAVLDLNAQLTKINSELEQMKAAYTKSERSVAHVKATLSKTQAELEQSKIALQNHMNTANALITERTAQMDKELVDFKVAFEKEAGTVINSCEAREAKLKDELDDARKEIASLKAQLESTINEVDLADKAVAENTKLGTTNIFSGKTFDISEFRLPSPTAEVKPQGTIFDLDTIQNVTRAGAGVSRNAPKRSRPGASRASKKASARVGKAPREPEDSAIYDQGAADEAPVAIQWSRNAASPRPFDDDTEMVNAGPSDRSPMPNAGIIFDQLNAEWNFNDKFPYFDPNGEGMDDDPLDDVDRELLGEDDEFAKEMRRLTKEQPELFKPE